MPVMAKKKVRGENQPPRVPPPNRTGVPLYAYIPPALRDALDALVARNRRSITAEVQIALERHLQAEGMWPPSAPSP
jgi:hypothetical protein